MRKQPTEAITDTGSYNFNDFKTEHHRFKDMPDNDTTKTLEVRDIVFDDNTRFKIK